MPDSVSSPEPGEPLVELAEPVGLIGGTGPEGMGLAVRIALAGRSVIIGSRDPGRAAAVAVDISALIATRGCKSAVSGAGNLEAADHSGAVVLSIPFAAQAATIQELAPALEHKIVISVIAPLKFSRGRASAAPPPEGSAAEAARAQLPSARWVSGFHTFAASELADPDVELGADILIASDDNDAKLAVMNIANRFLGARAVDAGALESARQLEGAVAMLININKIYGAHGALRIVGI
jgi:NADPH-dependent F420 reductase